MELEVDDMRADVRAVELRVRHNYSQSCLLFCQTFLSPFLMPRVSDAGGHAGHESGISGTWCCQHIYMYTIHFPFLPSIWWLTTIGLISVHP